MKLRIKIARESSGILGKLCLLAAVVGIIAFTCPPQAFAAPSGQGPGHPVTGQVIDKDGLPVVGAGVFELGNTANGAVTDGNGNFRIVVPADATLRVSCIGYSTFDMPVQGRAQLTITLDDDAELLDDVVVVAFGQMSREAFTGSAGTMTSDALAVSQVSNPAQALAGRVAGVQLTNSTGNLGSSPSILIRGVGSISSDTEPLIVLDGMPFDGDLNLINSADIESMTVLKDAASNALYGARGANGVIMITTKKAKQDKATITIDAKWGINQNGLPKYKTMNAKEFYETYYNMLYNTYYNDEGMSADEAHAYANSMLTNSSSGVGPGYMIYTVPSGENFILQGGTMNPNATMGAYYTYGDQTFWLQADDWEDEGLQNGFRQEYNISVSGRTEKANIYASVGYLDQEGIQENSYQTRLTARLKADYQAKDWLKIGGNFNFTNYEYAQTGEGTIGSGTIWSIIKTQAPIYPVYIRGEDKQIMTDSYGRKVYDFAQSYNLSRAGGVGGNAIFSNKYEDSKYNGNSFIASGYADFTIIEGLVLTVNANMYDYDRRYSYISDPYVDMYTSSSDNGSIFKSSMRTFTYNTQQLLNYNKSFGKHNVGVMLGHEYYKYKYEYLGASGYNFGVDGASELDALLNLDSDPSSSATTYNNEGYFLRALYDYSGKYYASASYRRDASSRFSKDNRWGDFWSVGGAWIISKEDFFDVSWIDELKFKASYGSQGNDNIGEFLYSDSYDIVNNNDEVSYQWRQKGNEDITWETNLDFNTGFEFSLLKDRLSGSVEYYYRKTKDMLFSLSTPPSIGYTSYYVNLGDMRNTGFELVLHATPIARKNIRWDVDFNISYVKNKVLTLPDDIKTVTVEGHNGYVNNDGSYVSKYQYFVAEGLSLYTWYLPKYAGVDSDTGEALYYVDETDDDGNVIGRSTTTDSSVATDYLCGDALPPFYGGLSTTVNFWNFDFTVSVNYQLGGKAYDYTYQTLMHTGGTTSTNWHVDMFDAWTSTNTDTDVPRLRYTEANSQNARSDRFLTSASYLNIQNVNLGYTVPNKFTSKVNIDKIRVYFSVENLGFFSARKGMDPRYAIGGYTNPELYSPIRTISGGIQLTF